MFIIKLGQKVVYKNRIHYIFYNHENEFYEIQSEERNIILVSLKDLIYRIK